MQETTLWEGNTCPLCESQGINSKLKFFRINFREAALLCKRKKCPFPLSTNYPDIFVRIGRDGNIIPGSQSERGLQHGEEADSDDSPYISDASEESDPFLDIASEANRLPNVSVENTNEKDPLEVDTFDINSIDFETEDSLDTFKLRNEITSLEMEITKSVENMKSAPPQVNCKDSSVFNKNNEKCINSGSVAAKAFTSADGKVHTDTQKELDSNGTRSAKLNENGVDYKKSGNIILREHDSLTGIPGSLEVTNISEELANCVQHSNTNTPASNKCKLNHKFADVQNNSSQKFRGGDCTIDDDDLGGDPEAVKITIGGSCSDSNVENQHGKFTVTGTSNPVPKPSIILIPMDIKKAMGNDLSRTSESHVKLVTNESLTFKKDNDCESEMCNNKEVVIIFDDSKNSDCSDNDARKQLDTIPVADASNPEPEPSVLLIPQTTKHTVENRLPRKCELHAELVSSDSVTIKKDNDCVKEMCGIKELVIISDDYNNSDGSDNIAEKHLNTVPKADTSNPRPEQSVLSTPQSMKNTVENYLPMKHELLPELVGSESVPVQKTNDSEKKCDDELDIIFKGNENSEVYEIVAIERDKSPTAFLDDSRKYEVINLQLRFCDNPKFSQGYAGRKTKKMHKRVQNTVEQYGKRSSGACSDSEVITPFAKIKVVEEGGLFRCTSNNASSSFSDGEQGNTYVRKTVHSKNCVCFLCSESNTRGITSHLDRALADLFPEERSTEKHLRERDLPTEKEVMRGFVRYMTGSTYLQNRKRSPKKRNPLFHL